MFTVSGLWVYCYMMTVLQSSSTVHSMFLLWLFIYITEENCILFGKSIIFSLVKHVFNILVQFSHICLWMVIFSWKKKATLSLSVCLLLMQIGSTLLTPWFTIVPYPVPFKTTLYSHSKSCNIHFNPSNVKALSHGCARNVIGYFMNLQ